MSFQRYLIVRPAGEAYVSGQDLDVLGALWMIGHPIAMGRYILHETDFEKVNRHLPIVRIGEIFASSACRAADLAREQLFTKECQP